MCHAPSGAVCDISGGTVSTWAAKRTEHAYSGDFDPYNNAYAAYADGHLMLSIYWMSPINWVVSATLSTDRVYN